MRNYEISMYPIAHNF